MKSSAMQAVCDAPMRWAHCFCYFCLILSLPLSIWATRGWFGVLLHFQVASGGAWLMERLLRRPMRLRKSRARGGTA